MSHLPKQLAQPPQDPLTTSPFRVEIKIILTLMLPILLTQMAQAGFGLVDTIMAGRVSAADLASVALGVGFWLPLVVAMAGILQATTPLVAEAFGAQDIDTTAIQRIPSITRQALWFALFLGLAGLVLLQLSPLLFDPLQVPQALRAKTQLFLVSISYGLPAVAFYTALRCYTEALGKPRVVTFISLCGLALVAPLDYLFIYGFHIGSFIIPALGGAGCGVASAILEWLMLLVLAGYLSVAKYYAHIRVFSHLEKPNRAIISRIARLGIPIGSAIFFEVTLFSLAALVLSPFGAIVVAAHQVALSATSQLFMIPLSLSIALTIRMGQLYGQQNAKGMRRVRRAGYTIGAGFAILTMSFIALCRHQIAATYSNDLHVQALAATLLLFAMGYQLVDSWQVTTAGCLRGMQDTAVPMWITFFAYWVVGFPVAIFLSRVLGYGAQGFWFGLLTGLAVAAFLLIFRLRLQERRIAQRFEALL